MSKKFSLNDPGDQASVKTNLIVDEAENKLKTTTIDQHRKAPMKIYLHCLRVRTIHLLVTQN